MDKKIELIRRWLGNGAINIFGIQFSGKDTLGVPLAKDLGANFISSGDIVRMAAAGHDDTNIQKAAQISNSGELTPTDHFKKLIVPYLEDKRLSGKPLVLDSVGRWHGEEETVMGALNIGGHPLKAVLILNIPEAEVWRRWELVKESRNGGRSDDKTKERVQHRLDEFKNKTLPVISYYRARNYTIAIDATGSIEETYRQVVDKLADFASK